MGRRPPGVVGVGAGDMGGFRVWNGGGSGVVGAGDPKASLLGRLLPVSSSQGRPSAHVLISPHCDTCPVGLVGSSSRPCFTLIIILTTYFHIQSQSEALGLGLHV